MPDIFLVVARRWRLVLFLTLAGTAAALLGSILSPKQYLSVVTALPSNALLNDKGRFFNSNIEALYSEMGGPDELDRVEGTAQLDTIYRAVAIEHRLVSHYGLDANAADATAQAALRLKKATAIRRSAYGELQINVWDRNSATAAALANALLQNLNSIHQQLLKENNQRILEQLTVAYADVSAQLNDPGRPVTQTMIGNRDTVYSANPTQQSRQLTDDLLVQQEVQKQREEYLRLIREYEMAVKTTPGALLVVEPARPSPWPDRPKTEQNGLLAFFASLLFSFLLAVLLESRIRRA